MDVLVLGGTGAMGVDLVQLLTDSGVRVDVTTRRARKVDFAGVRYLVGNAKDDIFLKNVLCNHYDCVIDFMVYSTNEFRLRRDILLKSAQQYVFLSSARVYADSSTLITETSPRLLDTIQDEMYLNTDEYALSKARQENVLRESDMSNWTIIRPYITYNDERLQLGVLEKEYWLYRALHGRTIVFTKDIATKITTLTYGYDVALVISKVVGNAKAFGQVFQIASPIFMEWESVLKTYLDTIENSTGKRPNVKYEKDSAQLIKQLDCQYQVQYDRLFNRNFDSSKIEDLCGCKINYTAAEIGITKCLTNFIEDNLEFRKINWQWEAYADRVTGESTDIKEINGIKNKFKYLLLRYFPRLVKGIKYLHHLISKR